MKANAGSDLAQKVTANLFEYGLTSSKIQLLLLLHHGYDNNFVLSFQNELGISGLKDRIGWDLGMNEDIISIWQKLEVTNIWMGTGYSNCLSPFYDIDKLTQVINKRDNISGMVHEAVIDKAYHWTVDFYSNLRISLE